MQLRLNMKTTILKHTAFATALSLVLAVGAQADDQNKDANKRANPDQSNTQQQYDSKAYAKGTTAAPTAVNKSSSLIGMAVKDQSGEKLGDIKDLVMDIGTGKISYAVFGTDGKERLFAVPLSAFQ